MGCTWMVIVGGVLEGIGFGVIVVQLALVQRQEFGWPQFVLRSWGWTRAKVRRLLRRPQHVHLGAASLSATASLSGRASLRRGMGSRAFDRFAAIEFNLEQIEKDLGERIAEVHESVERLGNELTTTRSTIEQREREREEERKAEHARRSLSRHGASCSSSPASS